MIVVGQGNFSYDVEEHWSNGPRPSLKSWGELPKGYSYIQVPGIGVDSKDRIYVYNRYPPRVYVLNNNGKFLNMWGEDIFGDSWLHSPHGLYVGSDDMVYCTDNLDHTVRKFTLDGELIFTLGTEEKPGKEGAPFNRPTATALSKSGDLFISDGYGNSRVHKFSPDGEHQLSWGKPGTGPGEFNLPHGIWVDKDDRVWVADRQNHRIQIFTTEGEYISQLTDFSYPSDFFMRDDIVYVAEVGGRMSILNLKGELLSRWGGEKSFVQDYISKIKGDYIPNFDLYTECLHAPGKFVDAHCCCVDSKGSIYVGEIKGGVTKFIRRK